MGSIIVRFVKSMVLLGILSSTILASIPANIDTTIQKNEKGKRIYKTQRFTSPPPKIDGRLDDVCWQEGIWSGHYTQQIPTEGAKPTAQTALKILYDDNNIYIAICVFDDPAKIDRTAGRRDSFDGDIVGVCFDSYFDHRTGFEFDLTAAGSKIDLVLMNEGWDTSWDAVWDGKVAQEDSAWTAEFRVPLSQLRYSTEVNQIWGLHAWRWINRNNEEDQWALIPRDTPGRMYDIGELHGITGLPKNSRFELLPYLRAQNNRFPKEQGNPFATGSEMDYALGLDGKFGLSSDFTMDFTINPDFGQVEADPSVLNLTVFETFYEEKRPFFLEGKNIYDFDFEQDLLFYSRRIGHGPSYSPDLGNNEYSRLPENTAILGAAKISGKSKNGLSIGILESVTAKEFVEKSLPTGRSKQTAEPLTNYFVSRVQKEYNHSNTILGGIFTATNRHIQEKHLSFLNRSAYTGGLDFKHHWKDKTYYIEAKTIFSRIYGAEKALLDLQTASARYFQRPDADHVSVDSMLTTLSGSGGMIEIGKGGNGNWRWQLESSWRSPGLELNDMGFLTQTDFIAANGDIGYVQNVPNGLFRSYSLVTGVENSWNFGKNYLGSRAFLDFESELANKWRLFANVYRETSQLDVRLLRGGPAVKIKGWLHNMYRLSTDNSKRLTLGGYVHYHLHDDDISKTASGGPFLNFKVTNTLHFNTEIDYSKTITALQYINTFDFASEKRYVLGELDRSTLGITLRLDYAITPELTIQYYGNPYFSIGEYTNIKRVTNPRAEDYNELYHIYDDKEIQYVHANDEYQIDERGDGSIDYRFDNPDFNFREFHSNLVARWEFKPGSTLYLVWTHGRSLYENISGSSIGDGLDSLFETPAQNVFLVKFNYWFSM